MRLINETRQVENDDEDVHRAANGELIRVQDATSEEGRAAYNNIDDNINRTPGLLESCLSPDLPDRKRYAIKEKVSLGIYKPSFTMQPDTASLTNVQNNIFREHNTATNINDKSIEESSPQLKTCYRDSV